MGLLDISVLSDPSSDNELSLGSGSGLLVSGVTRLAQRVLLELFTERGSMQHLPDRGCDIARSLRQKLFSTEFEVMSAFTAALAVIGQQLRAEETSDDADDECLGAAEVTRVVIAPGGVMVSLRIQSLAGLATTTLLIPIRLSL